MTDTANASLLEIAGPGDVDRNGDTLPGDTVWSGRVDGYLKQIRRQVVQDGQSIRVRLDTFVMLATAGAPALAVAGPDWEASTVLIEDRRATAPALRRFTVTGMENRAAGTVADSVRLELDDEVRAA